MGRGCKDLEEDLGKLGRGHPVDAVPRGEDLE